MWAYLGRWWGRSGWSRRDWARLWVEARVQVACWRHEERCVVRTGTESGCSGLPDCWRDQRHWWLSWEELQFPWANHRWSLTGPGRAQIKKDHFTTGTEKLMQWEYISGHFEDRGGDCQVTWNQQFNNHQCLVYQLHTSNIYIVQQSWKFHLAHGNSNVKKNKTETLGFLMLHKGNLSNLNET